MTREIKQLFFTYRNGAVADTLRRYGSPYKVIFGLDIPRIAEIARRYEPSDELAETLWEDREVRESRLLATYLFEPAKMTTEKAIRLAREVRTIEEADMLSFRQFKRMAWAADLLAMLEKDPSTSKAATSLRQHLA